MKIRTLCCAALLLLLAACSRATPGNYEKIESGMSRAQVYDILGKPDTVQGGGIGGFTMSAETWAGPDHTIVIDFAGDNVAFKSIRTSAD